MFPPGSTTDDFTRRTASDVLRNVSYEIMPFRGIAEAVHEHVPPEVALSVTATASKGIETTVRLAAHLTENGYRTTPHLAARMIKDRAHAIDLLAELTAAGVNRVFVVGGDMPSPAGAFRAAAELIQIVDETGDFQRVGFGGYPEGHATIGDGDLRSALARKAASASHVITQICFDAGATIAWARGVHRHHPQLGVIVGVPAPVSRQKLMRISANIGLGQSARFLRKQQGLMWRLMQPGGYRPDRLIRAFSPHLGHPDVNIQGFHLFTFNELRQAEAWRQTRLARLRAT